MENAFTISNRIYGTFGWLERTPSLIILGVIVMTISGTVLAQWRKKALATNEPEPASDMPNLKAKLSIEGGERNPLISVPFAAVLAVLFAAAAIIAIDFHHAVRLYPMMISITAVVLLLLILWSDGRAARNERTTMGSWHAAWAAAEEKADFGRSIYFCLWLAGTIVAIWLFGNTAGVALFMGAYIIVWGKRPLWLGALYAAGGYAFITFFYDRLMHIPLQRPAILRLFEAAG